MRWVPDSSKFVSYYGCTQFQLVAQSCKDQYARGPCVAALDEAGDAVDKLSSKVKVPHSDTLHSKFETWKAQRLSLAKSQL